MRRALALLVCAAFAAFAAPAWADDHEPERGAAAATGRAPAAGPARTTRKIPPDVRFDQDFTNNNLVKMTVTNYGFYGNNFFKRDASLEYPANRGYEHMVRGGLWVGAQAQDASGPFTGVTTGTVDAAQGPSSPEASEFTPGNKQVFKRSTQPGSEFFERGAISELDVVSDFNDTSATRAASVGENHRALQISVHHENFQWNFADLKNLLFFRITVKNIGPLLRNVWIGIYTEFASGYKDGYVVWPPSSGDAGGLGSWFNNKWIVYDDSLSLEREHYCDAGPPPDGCIMQRAPYWIGLRYLGARPLTEDTTPKQLTLAAWSWAPGSVYRDQDGERYAIMSAGTIQPLVGDTLQPSTGDPVELFAVGPFPFLYNDSTVTVNFAIVGGNDVPGIQRNSKVAQFVYDNDYIPPIPPGAPRVHVAARDTALDIYWDRLAEDSEDPTSPNPRDFEGYRVYVGEDPDTLALVAQFDAAGDTAGFNTGFPDTLGADSLTVGSVTYHYKHTVRGLRNGFKYYCAVTSFDIGNRQIEPLESGVSEINRLAAVPGPAPGKRPKDGPTVFPNPYRVEAAWDTRKLVRDHYLWFANLPERCTLRIFTLSGDLVFEKDFDGTSYRGEGTRGLYDPSKGLGTPVLSGSMFGWDMITREGQAIATGLYLYSVEDRRDGKRSVGKFLVIKSDRESTR